MKFVFKHQNRNPSAIAPPAARNNGPQLEKAFKASLIADETRLTAYRECTLSVTAHALDGSTWSNEATNSCTKVT